MLGLQIEDPTPEGEISFEFMAALLLASTYLSYDFGQAYHTSFSQTIIRLSTVLDISSELSLVVACYGSRIPMNPTRAADVYDVPWLAIFDSEIGCGGPDQPERCSIV